MSQSLDVQQLLKRLEQGDRSAADEIFAHYAARLIALARPRLSGRLARRVDPEDVVQSAFGSVFRRATSGDYYAPDGNGLWPLLAQITVNKAKQQQERHFAAKRSLKREESFSGSWSGLNCAVELLVAAPTVEEADMLVEELEWALRQLEPGQRAILELRLDGVSVADVAVQVGRTERTVHRVLARVRKLLEERGSAIE